MKENRKGYVIFNAEGKQPTATLAALDDPKFVQVVVNGSHGEMIKLFGSIANALHESDVPKEILHTAIDAAIGTGEHWAAIMTAVDRTATEVTESRKDPEDEFDKLWRKFTGKD